MEETITHYLQNITIGDIINDAIGAIGVIFTIVAYYKSRRGQKPRYASMTSLFRSKLIENSSIEIRHAGHTIQDLAVTKVAIWNAGTTIKREDIATKDPLHISTKGDVEILEVQLLYSEKQNDISWQLSQDKKNISIDLEYLAKREGMVFKIFHTGTSSNSLEIGCSLTSGKNLHKSEWKQMEFLKNYVRHISVHFLMKFNGWLIVLMCMVASIETILSYNKLMPTRDSNIMIVIAQIALYLILALYAYRTFISTRLPKKLYKYYYGEY